MIATLDTIETDSYAFVVEVDGMDVLVVGVDEPDAFLDASLPASWLEVPAYALFGASQVGPVAPPRDSRHHPRRGRRSRRRDP